MNDGSGVFANATATNLPDLRAYTTSVALGDVDGDGDLDALVGNDGGVLGGTGEQNRLYLNSGAGVFTDATATNLPALRDTTRAIALGDLDGDGDLDALVGNAAQQDRLYWNDGTGVFADATPANLPALPTGTKAMALGDLDGDGDLDAFVGKFDFPHGRGQQNHINTNQSRHLAWRGIPRAGKPLVLDIAGPAKAAWVLGASLSVTRIPVPPLGTLWLDPATLFAVVSGTLDSRGRASLSYVVPPNPALVGTSVYWQGVLGAPALLSNLEVTTVTGF